MTRDAAPARRPDLLLLPGLLCDARLWQPVVDALHGHVGKVVVADLSGADTVAALAAAALARAPGGRFALAGLSMGGYVALELLRQAPQRVSGLALLDTSARPDTAEATAARRAAMALAETDFAAVIEGLLPRLILPARLNDAALTGLVRDMARQVGPAAFQRQQNAIIGRPDSRPHLPAIACPTLVLCGRLDQLTPVPLHEEMAAAIPGAQLLVLEECAHLSTLEQPPRVAAALQAWLAGLPAGG